MMRWVEREGQDRGGYKFSIGKSEGNRSLGRPKCKWDGSIRNVKEIGWKRVEWTHPAQDSDQWGTVMDTIMNSRPV